MGKSEKPLDSKSKGGMQGVVDDGDLSQGKEVDKLKVKAHPEDDIASKKKREIAGQAGG